MTELILFSLFILAVFCIGLFIGYSLSRRKDDKPIITNPLRDTSADEPFFNHDVYEQAMHTEEELEEQKIKREPTIL